MVRAYITMGVGRVISIYIIRAVKILDRGISLDLTKRILPGRIAGFRQMSRIMWSYVESVFYNPVFPGKVRMGRSSLCHIP